MKNIFEYIYYRLNKFYYKWDGPNGSTSAIGISMVQMVMIINITIIPLRFYLGQSDLSNFLKKIDELIIVILACLVFVNIRIYKDKYNTFTTRWQNETPKQKRTRGFLVVMALLTPWIIFITFLIINSNLAKS